MKPGFSKTWKKSAQARKHRKYIANAPLHIKGKLLSSHLSKELREKYGTRTVRLRVGDKVKVMKGNFKGDTQKVEKIDIKNQKVYLEKIEFTKKDGSKATRPLMTAILESIFFISRIFKANRNISITNRIFPAIYNNFLLVPCFVFLPTIPDSFFIFPSETCDLRSSSQSYGIFTSPFLYKSMKYKAINPGD